LTKPEDLYTWSVRWLQTDRDMNPKPADEVVALTAHLQRIAALKDKVETLVPDVLPKEAATNVEWYRLEAQLWLEKAKAK
jgi:hypothetical protein